MESAEVNQSATGLTRGQDENQERKPSILLA